MLPFGAAESDYASLRTFEVRQTAFDPCDGKRHWVYVGVCGSYMTFALRSLFAALLRALEKQPALRRDLRLHFIGTDYAPKNRATKTVEPLAREAGLTDMIVEQTDRLPYFEALQCLLDADALIVPGSDDPGYTASKIYPYILARKPLLAVFHESSTVINVLRATKAGTVVAFANGEDPNAVSHRIQTAWFDKLPPASPDTDWNAFEPYSAREMTRKLCSVFNNCL